MWLPLAVSNLYNVGMFYGGRRAKRVSEEPLRPISAKATAPEKEPEMSLRAARQAFAYPITTAARKNLKPAYFTLSPVAFQ